MKTLRYCFYLIIAMALLLLAAMNSQEVTVHYYWGERVLPLSLLMLFALCGGCFFGLLLSMGSLFKLRKERRQWQRQASIAEKQLYGQAKGAKS